MFDLDEIINAMIKPKEAKEFKKGVLKAHEDALKTGIGVVQVNADKEGNIEVSNPFLLKDPVIRDVTEPFPEEVSVRKGESTKELKVTACSDRNIQILPTVAETKKQATFVDNINSFDIEIAKQKLDADSVMNGIVEQAKDFVIETDDQAKRGLDMAMQARDLNKAIEKSRKEIIRPHLDYNVAVNKLAKDLNSALEKITKDLTKKANAFHDIQKKKFQEANIATPPKKPESNMAKPYETTDIDIDVVDITLVPREFLVFDKRKAMEAVRAGARNIPGLKIKVEKKILYRTKK